MANTTHDLNISDLRVVSYVSPLAYDALAATQYYAGSVIEVVAGNAAKATGTPHVAGIVQKAVDNTLGATGDVKVLVQPGVFGLASSGLTKANIGTEYAMADDTNVGAPTVGGGVFLVAVQDGKTYFSVGLKLITG